MKIFFDVDGVLADFDAALLERSIVNKTHFIHKHKSEWTEEEIALDKQVVECMQSTNWFYNLPVMKGAHDMVELAHSKAQVWALTARPKIDEIAKDVEHQKRAWLNDHFDELFLDTTIVCLRHEKAQYATTMYGPCDYESNILIDDMTSNCDEWRKAGGIAIQFQSAEQVMKQLDKVVKEINVINGR